MSLEAGVPLTCVDSSGAMLAILRKKLDERGFNSNILEADVCDLHLSEKYPLAMIPFHSFSELLTDAEQAGALSSIAKCLTEGGRLIVTLQNPPSRLKRVDGQLHLLARHPLSEAGDVLLLWAVESYDERTRLVTGHQFFEAYDPDGLMKWRRIVDLTFRLVTRAEFEALAQGAGLSSVTVFGDYSRSPFEESSSPFMIWMLQK
jgi:SAM-dependent methyltransferase